MKKITSDQDLKLDLPIFTAAKIVELNVFQGREAEIFDQLCALEKEHLSQKPITSQLVFYIVACVILGGSALLLVGSISLVNLLLSAIGTLLIGVGAFSEIQRKFFLKSETSASVMIYERIKEVDSLISTLRKQSNILKIRIDSGYMVLQKVPHTLITNVEGEDLNPALIGCITKVWEASGHDLSSQYIEKVTALAQKRIRQCAKKLEGIRKIALKYQLQRDNPMLF